MKKRILFFILPIFIFGFILVECSSNLSENEEINLKNEDFNLELKGINTADVNLKQLKNKKIFLNFWGTWCPPCRKEWPTIEKLFQSRKNSITFVLIAMNDDEKSVKKFLEKNHFQAPVYFAKGLISEKFLPKSFPTTFIIDEKCKVILKQTKAINWNSEKIKEILDRK